MIAFRKSVELEENLEVIPVCRSSTGSVDLVFESWTVGPTEYASWRLPMDGSWHRIPGRGNIIRVTWQEVSATQLRVRVDHYDASAGTWTLDAIDHTRALNNVNGVNFLADSHRAVTNTIDSNDYTLGTSQSARQTYPLDAGPVKVSSTNTVPLIAALRDAYLVGNQVESFAQLMGLPREQLSDTYYFPAYNNVTLDGQLRFGNVDTIATDVTVAIGGVVQGTYTLQPNESKRVSYPLDTGPVVIKSSNGAKIVAALRDAYLSNGQVESFVQLMGLPKEQLSDTYYFPAYNNLTLSGQLRFGVP